jgi:GT2 family glycosyltransferase
MKENEHVCAVICNWNKQDDVVKCVDSVLKSSYSSLDVVVVDNASSDDSVKILKETFDVKIKIIENPENLGGAGGFNTGLRFAVNENKYRSVWLLDNDVKVDKHCLEELVKELRKSRQNAIIGSLILRMDSPATLQELGAFINKKTFKREANKRDFALHEIGDEAVRVDYVPACSLLVDMEKLKEVGIMDEEYFLYFDDVEWCTRFKKKGYDVLSTPRSRVWHKEGGRNKTSNLPVYYTWRNHLHFFLHYLSDPREIDDFVEKQTITTFTAIYITLVLGKINACQTIVYAVADTVGGRRGKAKEDRIFPLDDNVFGQYFYKDFKRLKVIGESLDFYTQFENFLEALENPSLEIEYFTRDTGKILPEKIRDRVSLEPVDKFAENLEESEILVFCKHILSEPNSYEETFRDILKEKDAAVFYLDQYSNFFQGYSDMQNQRKTYKLGKKEVLKMFSPLLKEMFQQNQ